MQDSTWHGRSYAALQEQCVNVAHICPSFCPSGHSCIISFSAALEPVKLKHSWISYGDLWTLAGVVAIEAMDGPKVQWRAGMSREHVSVCQSFA